MEGTWREGDDKIRFVPHTVSSSPTHEQHSNIPLQNIPLQNIRHSLVKYDPSSSGEHLLLVVVYFFDSAGD